MIQAADVERMIFEERLQTMELLWASLSKTPDQVPSPEWRRDLLAARLAKIRRGEGEFFSIPQLKERLQNPAS